MVPRIACEILYDVVVWVWCMPVMIYHIGSTPVIAITVYISGLLHIMRALTDYLDIQHPCPCFATAVCFVCAVVLMTIGLPSAEKYGQLGPVGAFMSACNSFFLSMRLETNKIEL